MALTEKRVRDAKPSEKTRIEWDSVVKGLGLRVTPAGAKAFVLDYRAGGTKRRMTLGRAGALSLNKAREKAHALRQAILEGEDPLETARAEKSLPTVNEALDRFENEYVPRRIQLGRMAESTALKYRQQIARHLRPALGKKRVRDVTRRDIETMLAHSPEDTRKRRRGKTKRGVPVPPVSANRIRALASRFFRLCEDWGYREQNSNPARAVEKAVEEARDRTLSADELSALGRALSEIDANEGAVLAIRLAALTGLRLASEIRVMRWDDIDMKGGTVVLPKTKSGRRTHTFPSAALELLADTRKMGEFVIPGRTPERPLNDRLIRRVFEKACAEAGISGARVHDLRRTVMTSAASMGVSAHLLRDMVGHKTTAMADRYIRQAGEPLTELRERVGAGMAAQLEGTAANGSIVKKVDKTGG
ncbi:MAG: tyrosine-type recombinase/integrase [Pseudomonadota bacterium]